MLNSLLTQLRRYRMLSPGDRLICAVSGGADSVALLFGMYLLKDKLGITLEAAHFNHGLRGEESDRDQQFVLELCRSYHIPCHLGSARVQPGKKGLEAAAREARYGFFATLGGKIATAHTADDNAETVLMHLLRGTGLKGLGGISPVRGNVIRPMLTVTRQQVLEFLQSYHLSWVQDSSNDTDAFLRNRLRHHVMPLLQQENPRLARNLSAMAMQLRQDQQALEAQVLPGTEMSVEALRRQPAAIRHRSLGALLQRLGMKEPERAHILLAEQLVYSDNPSASASFPGNITLARSYNRLTGRTLQPELQTLALCQDAPVQLPGLGLQVRCMPCEQEIAQPDRFTVVPEGQIYIRSRRPGDQLRLRGGTKSLKRVFIDKKIPAQQRLSVPVVADSRGVLGVYGIGPNLDRVATGGGVLIQFESSEK